MPGNKKNILALAALIERLPKRKFAMNECLMHRDSISEDNVTCGSPSCIAGWAAWEEQGRPEFITDNGEQWNYGNNNLINSALAYFGIEDWDEKLRVMNELFRGEYGNDENGSLTNKDAAHALRTYAETGEIVWPDTGEDR